MAIGEQRMQVVINAIDKTRSAFDSARRNVENLQARLDMSADASKKFALALGAGGVAIAGLGALAIKAAADMEQTRISFTTMLGSAEKADVFIRQLVDFAKKTPFELKGLEQASKQLLAYGATQEEVIPELKMLGDITAGVGADKLPQLILAFGQVRAATKLTGMELRQFTEAGVPLLDELGKSMGKSAAEIKDMVSEGEIGFEDVKKAMAAMTGEGGRFNNLMEKQAGSLNGMISNLKDAWDIFLRGEGQQLLVWAKAFVAVLIDIIQNHLPKWIALIKQVVDFFQEHKVAIYIVAGAIVGALIPAILSSVVAFAALVIAMAPWLIGGAIVGGIVAGIVWIVQNWDILKSAVFAVWDAILAKINSVLNPIKETFSLFREVFLAGWNAIRDGVSAAIETIKGPIDWLIDKFNTVIEKARQAMSAISSARSSLVGGVKSAGSTIASFLPKFDTGGIVPGPIGSPQMILAHGGETVLPTHKGGFGGITINITGNTLLDRDAGSVIGNQIVDALRLQLRI